MQDRAFSRLSAERLWLHGCCPGCGQQRQRSPNALDPARSKAPGSKVTASRGRTWIAGSTTWAVPARIVSDLL
jgi:hypothetical protein